MRNRFLTRVTVVAIAACVAAAVTLVTAQAPGYRAPRAPDGKPNLNGIWQAINTANWDIEAHSGGAESGPRARGRGRRACRSRCRRRRRASVSAGGAGKKQKENCANRLKLDPEIKCYLPGVPRATYMPFPFQIIQSQKHIMIVHEFAGAVRTIYMTDQTEAPADSWMGWSNGRWEGETLVVDTKGFNDLSWFDRAGNFHSDALHVVERFTARSAETLNYEVTIEDPKVFTRPWKMSMPLYRRVERNAQILEFRCVEFVEDLLIRTSAEAAGQVDAVKWRGR